jgi:carbamoyl-phosphate synthase large subunit
MNVLLTCAGRRNYLIAYFRQALAGRGRILGADANPDAPALLEADGAYVLPPVDDPDYIRRLLKLCVQESVEVLVSLNDFELPLLANAQERFVEIGVQPIVSSPEVIAVCADKWRTFCFLVANKLSTPMTYTSLREALAAVEEGRLSFPVIVKPRWGTGSIGIDFPSDEKELCLSYELARSRIGRTALARASASDPVRCILIQERLTGAEFGVDVVNTLTGDLAAVFVRRKLGMRAGETDRAETVDNAAVTEVGRRLSEGLRHVGNLDCDVFVDGEDVKVLEMNPRFGGGYPFSHAAGADIPAAILAWARGEPPDPSWLRTEPGVTAAKCDRLVVRRRRGSA